LITILKNTGLLWLVLILVTSCHQKGIEERTFVNQEHISFNNHFNSLIKGKILHRYKATNIEVDIYKEHDALADVQILEIQRNGQNYHGQYNEGDTISIFFHFTLDNTKKLFPELNYPLPGLKEKDIFQAELIEKQSEVHGYKVLEYKFTGQ
jgi:hypothetical protein